MSYVVIIGQLQISSSKPFIIFHIYFFTYYKFQKIKKGIPFFVLFTFSLQKQRQDSIDDREDKQFTTFSFLNEGCEGSRVLLEMLVEKLSEGVIEHTPSFLKSP